ncbi:cytochrome P450 [Auriscalpium vulgare]|uniref:Cytochrome P450 n=1 Tax=Auriscalpium vulgare TaxID=40419 RepID=A0ACB8RXV2_9AGAM|nr:cytochrome P450 [Auriscalpium vulgare]
MPVTAVDVVVLIAFLGVLKHFNDRRSRRGFPFPPGPRGLPLIGNLFDIPKSRSWVVYKEWARKYGDIMHVSALGKHIVIISSLTTARDLLEKRAANYSDRIVVPMYQLMHLEWFTPVTPWGEDWRRSRRALDRGLRPNAVAQYRPALTAKVHTFLRALRTTPEAFREHIELLQGQIIMSITYGYDVTGHDDHYLGLARGMSEIGPRTILPGAILYNDLPILGYLPEFLPGMGFKALARHGHALNVEARNAPMRWVQDAIKNGTAAPSLTRESIRELEEDPAADQAQGLSDISAASGSLFTAGSDTTTTAMAVFFLVMTLFPDVQQRARAEVDAATRRERLPNYDDRAGMPYVNAVMQEILRWHTVLALGLPHAALEDDVYEGYFIPKGSLIMTNVWVMMHDPEAYPDPDAFNPARYITSDGHFKEDPAVTATFGFGRRLCPGRHLVDSTLYLVIVSVLATFEVRRTPETPAEAAFTDALVSHPEKFACEIVPRGDVPGDLISGRGPA